MLYMNVTLDHTTQEATNIRTFWFKPEHPVQYTAGQYIELTLKHDHPDERGEKHWFTLSSAPGHELVTITTKYAGDDKSSTFKKALFSREPGASLLMSEPMGDFVLPEDASRPLVFVAGGIGLTPFHSMAGWLAEHDEHRVVQFVYGVRSEDEIIFTDDFEKAGIHPIIVVGQPSDSWGGEHGQLSAELILGLTHPADNALVYLSGPEPMVEALGDALKPELGAERLVQDFFPGYENVYSK
jgi:ferredoxin-NADP reductase